MEKDAFINRVLLDNLKKEVQPKRVVIVYGPRQVGKTTLFFWYNSNSYSWFGKIIGSDFAINLLGFLRSNNAAEAEYI